jgi:hypothetical protein
VRRILSPVRLPIPTLRHGASFRLYNELLDEGFLFGREAVLPGASAGVADRQYPNEMALAAGMDGAAGAMADAAVEPGAAEDLGGGGEGGSELGAGVEDCLLIHLYK